MKALGLLSMVALSVLAACGSDNNVNVDKTLGSLVLSDISWLDGCWATSDGTIEKWTVADSNHGFAINYSLKENKVVFFEFARIDKASGDWAFYAYPKGVGPSTFPVQSQSDNEITFASANHDYPQVISYERKGNSLSAKISKLNGDSPHSWAFTSCA